MAETQQRGPAPARARSSTIVEAMSALFDHFAADPDVAPGGSFNQCWPSLRRALERGMRR